MHPHILTFDNLAQLKKDHPELVVHDSAKLAIEDIYDIEFPQHKDTKTAEDLTGFKTKLFPDGSDNWGSWVYYPWLNTVVHFPPKEVLRSLRTSRNRNLITASEQSKLYEGKVFIVGMSVGSNIVEALVSQGIGSTFILADMDIVEPSNLNRIRSPYHHIGLHKVDAISRKVWEIDPYIEIIQLLDGLNETNLEQTLNEHKVTVIVDEMDSLRMKIVLREQAKKRSLPVVMAADDGDDALVDIERYDIDTSIPLFHGRIPDDVIEKLKSDAIPRAQLGFIIGKYFVGYDNIPLRMYESLAEVGKTLPSWPQLGGAAALSGVSLAYAIRKIILGEKIIDGRVLVSIENKLDLEHKNPGYKEKLKRFQAMLQGE